jgi:hypothetical protein
MTEDLSWSSGRRHALGYDFEVHVSPGGPVASVRDYLAPFAVHAGTASSAYAVKRQADDSFTVEVDGQLFGDHVRSWRAVALLGWHINQSVVERAKARFTLLHAAAAARGDCAVLLPAPMEHGKTTTVTGLVRAGFSYLTDEAAALDPETLRVTAYPKPLTIDRGSWRLFPDLRPDGVDPDAGSWWVQADRIRSGATIASADPRLVVFPAYRRGSTTELQRLGQSAAIMRLAESTFAFASDGARNLATLVHLVRSAPVYELTIGDLDAAVELISGLVDERTRAA